MAARILASTLLSYHFRASRTKAISGKITGGDSLGVLPDYGAEGPLWAGGVDGLGVDEGAVGDGQLSVIGVDKHLRVTDEDLARPLERPWIREVNESSTKGIDLPPPSRNVEQLYVVNLS
jgi:hypothetical protein